jgi:hypothetical protein
MDGQNVRMILGLNGHVFVSPHSHDQPLSGGTVLAALHSDVARAAAAVRALVHMRASVEVAAVCEVMTIADRMQTEPARMLDTTLLHVYRAEFDAAGGQSDLAWRHGQE